MKKKLYTVFNPFPIIKTQRLILKQLEERDAEAVFKMRSDERVMKFIDRPIATSIQDGINLIKLINDNISKNESINWGVYWKETNQLIGIVSFWRIIKEHYRAETGYMLDYNFHRKGIMNEIMPNLLNYGFNIMNLHSVEANVNPNNIASVKLLEKFGFVREAYFKENHYSNGKFLDSAIYSLLNPNEK